LLPPAYIRKPWFVRFFFVPSTCTTIEISACRGVWAVLERPGVQSLFVDREKAIEHARRLLAGSPGLIHIRDEDSMLLTTVDLRQQLESDTLACA
jgi:hypothetical protein